MNRPIVFVGLSGTGKSTAGPLLAERLGRPFLDTDTLIEQNTGRAISTIFASEGEAAFREYESAALAQALDHAGAVVATGGGIVEAAGNRTLLRQAHVVWLTARPAVLAARLAAVADRPLLAGDPLRALEAQLERRAARYAALADWIVATDRLSTTQVVEEVARSVQRVETAADDRLLVSTPGGSYEVVIAHGALERLPAWLAAHAPRARLWIVSNDNLWPRHGERLMAILRREQVPFDHFEIPDGEAHKNLATVTTVYDWLLGNRVEREDVVLAFGGGVVGDLAGFVAATALRGIGLIQAPTTVLAMVDSSIGGKTGVDHTAGKNLIGAFYQPRLVLADTAVLETLPPAERQAGWAEAIKHGVIADARLFDDLVHHAAALRRLEEPITSEMLRRAAAIKVRVVSGDEREQGERILLNYGHTIGHALERWSNYTLRHGEAVAIGMCAAAGIARRLGLCDETLEERQRAALRSYDLPVQLPSRADIAEILQGMQSDKKVRGKRIRWVLPTAIGAATVRGDVPEDVVRDALAELAPG